MEVTLAVLADYANISREGKLNILGVFDIIKPGVVPYTHPSMQLVMKFKIAKKEANKVKGLKVELNDPTGKTLFVVGGKLSVDKTLFPDGVTTVEANQLLNLSNVQFLKEGKYQFVIRLNGKKQESIPLSVVITKKTNK